MLVCPKDLYSPNRRTQRSGVLHPLCRVLISVYIGQTGRSLKQRVSEHCCVLKNGDVQTGVRARAFLLQQVSVTLQRGNAASVLGSMGSASLLM